MQPHPFRGVPRPATTTGAIHRSGDNVLCQQGHLAALHLAATKLGEWYWNELPQHAGPWHLRPDDDDDDNNLATFREFAHRTKEETAKPQEDCGASVSGAQAAPPHPPPKERTVDKRGCFQAEPWQQRVLEWSHELARGVPPSTINRNITEVLTLYASEEIVPLACERQMRKLRGEVTIAGKMIAAIRVALCTLIIASSPKLA